jgi:Tol biopolymer transport system component
LFQVWEDKGETLFHWGYIPQATEICTIHADGSDLLQLTDDQAQDGLPVWSPDGQFIAYISASGERNTINIVREDDSQLRRLIENLDVWWEKPVWSPDGKSICFAAKDPLESNQDTNLYAATLEGKDVRALTALSGDELEARWSPDGTRLAFVWFPEGFKGPWSASAAIQITDIEGSSYVVVEDFAEIGGLTWSPDGTRLAFWARSSADCLYDCEEVYVADLSSNSMQCLTEQYEIAAIRQTVWSPDGEKIAFTARAPEGAAIYVTAPNGGGLSRVTPPTVNGYTDLVWAPDGRSIAFVRGIEGDKLRIWFVQIKGGDLQELRTP